MEKNKKINSFELFKHIQQYRKDNNLSFKEIFEMTKLSLETLKEYADAEERKETGEKLDIDKIVDEELNPSELSEETKKDFDKFWNDKVQEIIDFCNSHPDLKKMLEKKADEETITFGENDKFVHKPMISFYFSFDNLLESAEYGEWVPVSDSGIGFLVGRKTVFYKS